MVVECPECGTRFSLDENRITGATAQVRCSQCRQVFRINRAGQVVERPTAPPAQTTPPLEIGEEVPEVPIHPPSEAIAPPPAPEEIEAREEAAVEASEGPPPAKAPAAPKMRLRLWIVILMLAVPFLAALGWWVWQLHQPEPTSGPQTGPAVPAPLVVTPSPPPVPAADLRDLPVDWAQARYEGLVNAQGKQLLVIRGEVANEGKKGEVISVSRPHSRMPNISH